MLYYFPNRPFLLSPNHPKILEYSNDPDFDAEIKKNGTRLELQRTNSTTANVRFADLTFFNRHKEILNYNPCKDLLDELSSLKIPPESQLDGELMHFKTKSIKHTIFFYDIYVLDNQKMLGTLEERRQVLHDLFGKRVFKHIFISEQYQNDFLNVYNKVIQEEENEGLVIKNKKGKLVFNLNKSNDVTWQIKIRKENKNYKF